ncbi:efflux transporter outer membrane subunit [Trinickia caryophylli]|nr:efflux transporter outer membrane subunit [Trinickia caryophylli]PMS13103.1 RND transporter [Trinickia caryophylli]TRX15429.1 efflux transporter outer membrane subunit [Trinickia caryophylli]WQE15764.1 efflux transporter outer membrane subunit [Trinickia caryophylli]
MRPIAGIVVRTTISACRTKHGPSRAGVCAAGALAACFALASCTVGPDYRPTALPVPDAWSSAGGQTSAGRPELARWWTRLGDPLLDALVDEAVAGNLDVASAQAKVREARAMYRQAGATMFPALKGAVSGTRSGGASRRLSSGAPGSSSGDRSGASGSGLSAGSSELFQAGFDASWELDLFGANRRATEAAKYGVDAAQWALMATQLTLIGDVASSYVQARGYQARLALARSTAASQQETARITQLRYEAGATSGLDAANATGQAQTTLAAVPALEAAYTQAVHGLSVLSGRTPEALLQRMSEAAPLPAPRLPIAIGVPADVLLTRPDVRLAERRYAQSTARVGQAEAARYPSVNLVGSIVTTGARPGELSRRSSIGWSFGPSITVPIFNGGRLKAGVEVARAEQDQSFVAYRQAVLIALKDVEDASVALSRETERIAAQQAAVASYRTSSDLAHLLYRTGATGFLEVLTAERSLYQLQDALIQSEVLLAVHYVALNKALGGGWDGQTDTSSSSVARPPLTNVSD